MVALISFTAISFTNELEDMLSEPKFTVAALSVSSRRVELRARSCPDTWKVESVV